MAGDSADPKKRRFLVNATSDCRRRRRGNSRRPFRIQYASRASEQKRRERR